jgi:CheY-like chemotaxis protein
VSCTTYVLVVDDDEDIRWALADLLSEAMGHGVRTAGNGREALEITRNGPAPVLILLDVTMPVMNGPEFLAHKNGDPSLAGIPVCVMTASEAKRGEFPGVVSVLRKPFDIDKLVSIVEQYC